MTNFAPNQDDMDPVIYLNLTDYYASNDYIIHREYAAGKGFAGLVLIPRKNVDSPAIVNSLNISIQCITLLPIYSLAKYKWLQA